MLCQPNPTHAHYLHKSQKRCAYQSYKSFLGDYGFFPLDPQIFQKVKFPKILTPNKLCQICKGIMICCLSLILFYLFSSSFYLLLAPSFLFSSFFSFSSLLLNHHHNHLLANKKMLHNVTDQKRIVVKRYLRNNYFAISIFKCVDVKILLVCINIYPFMYKCFVYLRN